MSARVVAPDAPFFILHNLGSGNADAPAARAQIEGVLAAAGRSCRMIGIDDPRHLPALARDTVAQAHEAGAVVVAAGGDGTINTVAQALLDHGSGGALGVLPRGTFNYFSRTHGIPADAADATRLLLTARAHPVQAGLVNGRVFLVNASLGLYPRLLEEREAAKATLGRSRWVAFIVGVKTLLRGHGTLHIRLDRDGSRRNIRTPTLFVGNNRLQLEQVGIAEAAALAAGELVAITLRPLGTPAMLGLLLRGALGQLGDAERVVSFSLRQMTVRRSVGHGWRPLKIATDGETFDLKPPLDFRVAPEPLWLLRPEPDAAPQVDR